MENSEKYGPQSKKIEDLFEAFSNIKLINYWSDVRYELTKHYTELDSAAVAYARGRAYETAVKAGREEAWSQVSEDLLAIGTRRFWGAGIKEALFGLVVSDLVGNGITEKQLNLLLCIYDKYSAQVGKLFELTERNSPERKLALALLDNEPDWEEALSTAKIALSS